MTLTKTKFILPNAITLSSVFCGFKSIRMSSTATTDDAYYGAAVLLLFALLFDMLDGRVARLTRSESAFGVQLDSLADVISFGVAPAVLLHELWLKHLGSWGLVVAFGFVASSAARLARFNVLSTRPVTEVGGALGPGFFVGLPVPAAAAIVISLVLVNHSFGRWSTAGLALPSALLTVALSALMVSRVSFRTFKQVAVNAKSLVLGLLVLAWAVGIAIAIAPAVALVSLACLYVLSGIGESLMRTARSRSAFALARPPTAP